MWWYEFLDNFFSGVAAGIVLAALIALFGYLSRKAVGKYIRGILHIEVQLELSFFNSGNTMTMLRHNNRYLPTHTRFTIKNGSETAVDLSHAYLHLIIDTASSGFNIDTQVDSSNENNLRHFRIPLKGQIPKGPFSLQTYLQLPGTGFEVGGTGNIAAREVPLYYFFQTTNAYYPENVEFDENEFVVPRSCKQLNIQFV
jgi:hypothetical protein